MAAASKIRRKKEAQPRKPKKIVNVWESPFGKMSLDSLDPDSSLERLQQGNISLNCVSVLLSQ